MREYGAWGTRRARKKPVFVILDSIAIDEMARDWKVNFENPMLHRAGSEPRPLRQIIRKILTWVRSKSTCGAATSLTTRVEISPAGASARLRVNLEDIMKRTASWICVGLLASISQIGVWAQDAKRPAASDDQSRRAADKTAAAKAAEPAEKSAASRAPAGLPVHRVVLYKNGVGYFEHLGKVTGDESVHIDFTSGQLNDVLKSLDYFGFEWGAHCWRGLQLGGAA